MNQFEKKFVNEMWTMPLGSLLNAYGQINQGKGITASKLIEETQLLEDYAKKIVKVYHDEDIRPF